MEHTSLPITEKSQNACGCGCTDDGVPALDARVIPHAIRHATVFGALDAIPSGGSLDLIAPHNPLPLLNQISMREQGAVTWTYLVEGPEDWVLRLTRA